jgi:hypothetical protein
MSIFDRNNERCVIPMHRKNFWTNKWMQHPMNNFLQVSHHDPSVQCRIGWGSIINLSGSKSLL